jgi:chromosome segregation ATPase
MTENESTEPAEPGALVRSAAAVEAELAGLARLAEAVKAIELDSQEHLAQAGRTLADAFAAHSRAVEQMRALGDAVAAAHQRQREHAAMLEQTAHRLQQRSAEFAELTAELMAIGEETRQIALMLKALLPDTGTPARAGKEFTESLQQALSRLDANVERARLLQQGARARGIADIASQAEALAAQIAAAGVRLRAPADPKLA